MTREDIIQMAQKAGFVWLGEYHSNLEDFAERERIKQANAPEIERINAHIKEALVEREQDGECKYCTDGCPACDARELPKEAHDLF